MLLSRFVASERESKAMNYHRKCPVCSVRNIKSAKFLYTEDLYRCKQCGLVFDRRIPSLKELSKHYETYSYSNRKPVSTATQSSFSNLLEKFEEFRNTNNVLDVGCGQGDFLIAAKQRGWNVYGSEYSPAAVQLCKDAGITMYQGKFEANAFGSVKFDIVTSFEVIEHTNEPHDLISESLEPLRKGGLFYLTTPNYNSMLRYLEKQNFKMLGYPEHLVFYTPKSIRKLMVGYPLLKQEILTTGLDVSRIKDLFRNSESRKTSRVETMAENSKIRESMVKGKGIYIKNTLNYILTRIGVGDTLKTFYIKE